MLTSNMLVSLVSALLARADIPALGVADFSIKSGTVTPKMIRSSKPKAKVPHYPNGTFTVAGGKSRNSKAARKKSLAASNRRYNQIMNGTPKLEGSEKGFYQGRITDCLISRVPYQGMTVRKAVVYVKQWTTREVDSQRV